MSQGVEQHQVEQRPDGTYVVRDLPVLSETREDDPRVRQRRGVARGKAWLDRALELYRARAARGYEPPATFRHSDDNPERAGIFRPTRVGLYAVNPGEPERWTLFADCVFKSRETYETWKRDYPYRSPEMSPDYPDEVDALAFLSGDAPYNRFAIPAVVEMFRTAGVEASSRPPRMVDLFRAAGERYAASRRERMGSDTQARADDGKWSGSGGSGGGDSKPALKVHAGGGKKESKAERHARQNAKLGVKPENVAKIKAERDAMAAPKIAALKEEHQDTKEGDKPMGDTANEEKKPAPMKAPEKQATDDGMSGLHAKLDKMLAAHGEMMECMKAFMAPKGEKQEDTAEVAEKEPEGGTDEAETDAPIDAEPAVYKALKLVRHENEKMRAAAEKDRGEVLSLKKALAERTAREQAEHMASATERKLGAMGFSLEDDDREAIKQAAVRGKDATDALLHNYERARKLAGLGVGGFESYGTAAESEAAEVDDALPETVRDALKHPKADKKAVMENFATWRELSPRQQKQLPLDHVVWGYDERGNKAPASALSKVNANGRGI